MAALAQSQDHILQLSVQTAAGMTYELSPMPSSALVSDLLVAVREQVGMPICTQSILWEERLLDELCMNLGETFGDVAIVELTALQRPLSQEEQLELDRQLFASAAAGDRHGFQELLKEGAQMHSQDEDEEDDTSDVNEADCQERKPSSSRLTHLMLAIAAGSRDLAQDLRGAGVPEPDMTPKTKDLGSAFEKADLTDVVRHIAAGADVDVVLRRGQGIRATSSGRPLHACCALGKLPSAAAVAQLLIAKGADMSAGDAEGDTPLAHAKYFKANEIFEILSRNGAQIGGPFYKFYGRAS